MMGLDDLYQEVVRDHYANPRNFRRIEEADRVSEGFNPFCGDIITLYLKLDDARIVDVSFEGVGCAISKASASLMTEGVMGRSQQYAEGLFHAVHCMFTGEEANGVGDDVDLGDIDFLAGVTAFPVRVKCATLCWHTLRAALNGSNETVSTE